MGDVIDFARRPRRVGGFDIVADGTVPPDNVYGTYEFQEKPPAKSSVMKASVCQKCGCKLEVESMKPGCGCRCHRDGPQ